MAEERIDLYEGLFIVNQSVLGELEQAMDFVRGILERAKSEIVAIQKWDERRLAYPIKGQRRGLYILAYFRVSRRQIANIERDVTLSDEMLRCLVLRADHVGETELDLIKRGEKLTATESRLREGEPRGGSGASPSAGTSTTTATATEAATSSQSDSDTDGSDQDESDE